MINVLIYSKAYLYKREDLIDGSVKWNLVKKLDCYDGELELDDLHLHTFSPDFTQYIELDRKKNSFIIKDTITN